MPLSHILHVIYSDIQDYRKSKTFLSLTPFDKESDTPQYKTASLSDIIELLSYEDTLGKRFVDSFVIHLPEEVRVTYLGPYFMDKFKQAEHILEDVFFFGQVFHPSVKQDKCERHRKNADKNTNEIISASLDGIKFKNILHTINNRSYSFVVFGLILKINGIIDNIYNVKFSLKFASAEYIYCVDENTFELIRHKQTNDERDKFSPKMLDDKFNIVVSLTYRAAAEMSRNNYEEILHYDGITAYHVFNLEAISIPEKVGRLLSFSHSKHTYDFMIGGLEPKDYTGPANNLISHKSVIEVSSII